MHDQDLGESKKIARKCEEVHKESDLEEIGEENILGSRK